MSLTPFQQKLLTEVEIKSLLTRERYYRDTAQWQKLRDSFHPDASQTLINISWFSGTIEEFVAGSKRMASGGTSATHTITPVEIHFDESGSKAVSESVGSVTIRFSHGGTQFDCVSWTTFVSKLQNVDGKGWRLCSLEAIYTRDSITPVVPQANEKAAEKVQMMLKGGDRRESYKCIALVLEKGGFTVGNDMPGTDDPSSVARCMKEVFEWIR